jgi:hypothetical protein
MMLCPFHYYEINHCWAYIAAQQGGNAVLVRGKRQVSVYLCPTPTPTPTP